MDEVMTTHKYQIVMTKGNIRVGQVGLFCKGGGEMLCGTQSLI